MKQTRLAREGERQRLVSQAMSAAHFVGWKFNLARHLGLRLRLHPRLYAAARVRGLIVQKFG